MAIYNIRNKYLVMFLRVVKVNLMQYWLNIVIKLMVNKWFLVILQVSRNYSNLLRNRVIELEKHALSTAQYVTRETFKISPVPRSISNQNLEEQVCKALSLTGINLEDKDLHVCHRMKRKGKVILKFKDRKLDIK